MNGISIVPTYTLAFERTHRRGYYTVTINDIKRYIPSRLFYAVFPRTNRKVSAGSIEVTARQLEALGIIAQILDQNRYQIRYAAQHSYDTYGRPCATSYVIDALSLGQSIAITSAAFVRITGADKRATIGCMDVSETQLDELGFVRKEVADNVRIERPLQYA